MASALKYNYNIEALRGVAALIVVWHHIVTPTHKYYLNHSDQPGWFFKFNPPGHISVLIFFVLSGYVIGLTNTAPLNKATVLNYLKKRFVRIYPIYLLCLAFALFVSTRHYGFGVVFSNVILMQVSLARTVVEIDPAWSLNYEILFYLLFIPISFFRLNPLIVAAICVLLGVVNFFIYPYINFPELSAYAFGFSFWLIGLALANYFKIHKSTEASSYSRMISYLLVILSIEQFNILSTLFEKLTSKIFHTDLRFPTGVYWEKTIITFQDYAYLPYGLLALLVFVDNKIPFKKYIVSFLFIAPALTYIYVLKNRNSLDLGLWLVPSILYFIGIAFYLFGPYLERSSKLMISKLIPTGAISYGVYVVHMPILFVFVRYNYFSGSTITLVARLLVYLGLVIVAASILEKKFQPWIKRMVDALGTPADSKRLH
jgi:peptidoglycan/LPS O-acetylase OafA/YrhL